MSTNAHDTLISRMADLGLDVTDDLAAGVRAMSVADAEQAIANLDAADAERDALRDRLRADRNLAAVVVPDPTWGTPDSRYDVTRKALHLLEATAEQAGVGLAAVVEGMVADGNTLRASIALHGIDPRRDSYGPRDGGFYAWRHRCREGVEAVTAEQREQERREREAARDAAWEAEGRVRCDRCGGAGGHDGWPGWTCFECGGAGAVEAR